MMEMNKESKQALTFAILMQNIESKAPSYMMEKWNMVKGMDNPENLLDSDNTKIFKKWMKLWRLEE